MIRSVVVSMQPPVSNRTGRFLARLTFPRLVLNADHGGRFPAHRFWMGLRRMGLWNSRILEAGGMDRLRAMLPLPSGSRRGRTHSMIVRQGPSR